MYGDLASYLARFEDAARSAEQAASVQRGRVNHRYLPGVELPPTIQATHDVEKALHGANVVVLAPPSQTLRENLVGLVDGAEDEPVDTRRHRLQ